VDWVRVGETPFGAVEAKSSVRKSNGTGNSQEPAPHRLPPNRGSLQMLLQSARPTWSWSTLEAVVEKLAKIEIRSGLALLLELEARKEDPADESINRKLRAAGEKAFTADTLSALASRAEFLESEIRWRENQPLKEVDLDQFRSDTRGGAAPALEPEDIPEQRFRVVNFWAFVREAPSLQAPILCRKDVGDLVGARQQTFDGFVKLSGEPGWLLRDLGGEHGLGRVLEPLEPELPRRGAARRGSPCCGTAPASCARTRARPPPSSASGARATRFSSSRRPFMVGFVSTQRRPQKAAGCRPASPRAGSPWCAAAC